MRRKGERALPRGHFYRPYGPDHPVARGIATGDRWFYAWTSQYALNGPRLKSLAGITMERANELYCGEPITQIELDALAKACGVQPSDIIASLPDPQLLLQA